MADINFDSAWTVRARQALDEVGVACWDDFDRPGVMADLRRCRNVGETTMKEFRRKLKAYREAADRLRPVQLETVKRQVGFAIGLTESQAEPLSWPEVLALVSRMYGRNIGLRESLGDRG